MITGATILIVEDEAIVALDIKNRLGRMGYRVPAIALTGEEALAFTDHIQPDLIIMDIGLNGVMDGIQAAEQILSRFAVPIIFMTAYSDINTKQSLERLSPLAFLTKPFEAKELLETVQLALGSER